MKFPENKKLKPYKNILIMTISTLTPTILIIFIVFIKKEDTLRNSINPVNQILGNCQVFLPPLIFFQMSSYLNLCHPEAFNVRSGMKAKHYLEIVAHHSPLKPRKR